VDEKLTARAKLIYERDTNSPLFLRIADFHIRNNDPGSALSVLEAGLQNFPEHPLAFILLSKAYHLFGNSSKTASALKKASEILNSDDTYQHYKKEFNLTDKRKSPFDSSRGNIFMNSYEVSETEIDKSEDSDTGSVEDNLKQIAEKLLNTKIDRNKIHLSNEKNDKDYNPDKGQLASDTLANIYVSQGQMAEAIKIYEQLAIRNPQKKEFYLDKIRKLKSL